MSTTPSAKQKVFDMLLLRMKKDKDFPALSESISTIYQLASKEDVSVTELANTILSDFSLTNKLLRLVNSAFYGQYGEDIGTISRAITVLGFEQIRNAASSLLLFDNLKNRAYAGELLDSAYRALFSSSIARELAATADVNEEEARICAMFHSLGLLLVIFYFGEEYGQIRKLAEEENITEKAAALRILGIGFEDLGMEIARNWKFPDDIIESMQELTSAVTSGPKTAGERLRTLSSFSNEICRVASVSDAAQRTEELKRVVTRFKGWHNFTEHEIKGTLDKSMEDLSRHAAVFEINMRKSQFFRKIQKWSRGDKVDAGPGLALDTDSGVPDDGLPGDAQADFGPQDMVSDHKDVFLKGIHEIMSLLLRTYAMDDIFRMILETMYRAMGFNHVLLCVRDQKKAIIVARFGFGQSIEKLINHFTVPMSATAKDVFVAAATENRDIFVQNASDPKWAPIIPYWYRQIVNAETFILLPITVGTVNIGLFYADFMKSADSRRLTEESLGHMKTLRDQAILAIKSRK